MTAASLGGVSAKSLAIETKTNFLTTWRKKHMMKSLTERIVDLVDEEAQSRARGLSNALARAGFDAIRCGWEMRMKMRMLARDVKDRRRIDDGDAVRFDLLKDVQICNVMTFNALVVLQKYLKQISRPRIDVILNDLATMDWIDDVPPDERDLLRFARDHGYLDRRLTMEVWGEGGSTLEGREPMDMDERIIRVACYDQNQPISDDLARTGYLAVKAALDLKKSERPGSEAFAEIESALVAMKEFLKDADSTKLLNEILNGVIQTSRSDSLTTGEAK